MKYKPGDKFILTVKSGMIGADEPNYLTDSSFFLSESTLDTLEAYDEIKERLELIEELKQAEYKRGLNDAWETAWKILLLKVSDVGNVFNVPHWSDVFKNYTAEEALERIRAYEESQEIHVGDEVESCRGRWVVCKTDGVLAYGLDTEWVKHIEELSKLEKTGRHFTEVSALLDKLKGDAPDV